MLEIRTLQAAEPVTHREWEQSSPGARPTEPRAERVLEPRPATDDARRPDQTSPRTNGDAGTVPATPDAEPN